MKYYALSKDDRLRKPLELANYIITQNKDYMDSVIAEDFTSATKIVDYIYKKQLFDIRHIVSEMVKDVFDSYQQDIEGNAIFITDNQTNTQYTYWEVRIEPLDCLVQDKGMAIANVKLLKNKIENCPVFTIAFDKQNYIVVRFDVAESIMRRLPTGIKFIPMMIVEN